MSVPVEATNPYAAPQSRVDDVPGAAEEQLFYVVAPRKFLLLMIGTAGLYTVYWFYKNWALLNRKHQRYWPVMRAIFSIFFTHSLFNEVDGRLRARGATHSWQPGLMAGVYVISAVASQLLGRAAAKELGSPITDVLSLLMLVPTVWSLYVAQLAINVADGDPQGLRNSAITGANVAWVVFGALLWMLTALGLYVAIVGVPA